MIARRKSGLNIPLVAGQLVTKTKLDYETKNTYSVRLRVTDQVGLSFDKAFSIAVTDVLLAGDVNGDDQVKLLGLAALRTNFNKAGASRAMGDLNGDGKVDILDFGLLRSTFNQRV